LRRAAALEPSQRINHANVLRAAHGARGVIAFTMDWPIGAQSRPE
jgi:hypothetical protein